MTVRFLKVWLLAGWCLLLAACQTNPTGTPLPTVAVPTPAQLPSGTSLLYYSDQGTASGWYLIQPDGTGLQRLTFARLGGLTMKGLVWSPGLKAFIASLSSTPGAEDLYLIDLQGNILQRLTQNHYGESDASYSAAADRIVYVCVEQDLDICLISPNATNRINLTLFPSRDSKPTWSPNGQQILFVSNRDAAPGIWVINKLGTGLTDLSKGVQTSEGDPSWSADGKRILFDSQRSGNWDIYVMDADGQNAVNLTNNPARDFVPKWSPDGKYVAFRSDRTGKDDIFVMQADGSNVVNVSNTPNADEADFIWSLDSQQIVFVSDQGGDSQLYRVNRDGTSRTAVTHGPGSATSPAWVY